MDVVRPLDRCLNPVRVVDSDGVHFYPCGKCLGCKKSYHIKWRERLIFELQKPDVHALFITLTYSNEHIPFVCIDPDTREITSVSRTVFKRGKRNILSPVFKRVKCSEYFYNRFGREWYYSLPENYLDCFPHIVKSRSNRKIVFDDSHKFAICYRKDVQDFVKRLRTCLSRCPDFVSKNTSFTYFICSEYGPETFRPHYHGILFFRDPYVAQQCNDTFIFDAWRKCDRSCLSECEPISKPITFSQGAASYVSKYVTCDSVLPPVLSNPLFSPFHLQSHSTPIGSEAFDLDCVPDKIAKGDIIHHRSFYSKKSGKYVSVDLPYPSSVWSRVFPRFLFERSFSDSTLYSFFKTIHQFIDGDLPDFRAELVSRYNIGALKHSSDREFHPFTCGYLFDLAAGNSLRSSSWHGYSSLDVCKPITFSDVLPDLVDDPNFTYYYLFGIPQNRTACRKILSCMKSVDWCKDIRFYFEMFLRFRCLSDIQSLKSQFEYSDTLMAMNHYEYTPSMVFEIYPHLRFQMLTHIDDYDIDYQIYLETCLNSRFNLSLNDFYDEKGVLSVESVYNFGLHNFYRSYLYYYFNEKNCKARYNYNKFNDF